MAKLILTGDVNLMNVTGAEAPFRHVGDELRAADIVFGNLECCLHLPDTHGSAANEGFFADAAVGSEALTRAGFRAVGIANNVNYGAAAIAGSIARLDAIGVGHTGAGPDLAAARAPAIVERNGASVGFLQRSSVYWPTDHEAGDHAPGIAVIRGHTAYHVPSGRLRKDLPPANRPGVPPEIITWADPAYLADFKHDIAALRPQVGVVVASCHWGLGRDPLQYMTEIAHAAIDAGADLVIGHGPHELLPVEIYNGRPIFYGVGNLSFKTGHLGRTHGDWIGMLIEAALDGGKIRDIGFRFVRHNDRNESFFCRLADESDELADMTARSKARGCTLSADGDSIRVAR